MKTLSKLAGILFFTATMALSAQAAESPGMARERMKAALNAMVQEVRAAPTPAEKRAVMERFLDKAQTGAGIAEKVPFSSRDTRAALDALQEKFAGYAAQLGTEAGQEGVADADLDAFAAFMQQDLEQADSWSSGGIYLSTGAVIIILLILILIT